MAEKTDVETRLAALEALCKDLQKAVASLQKQVGPVEKPSAPPLRSRGMIDRPSSKR